MPIDDEMLASLEREQLHFAVQRGDIERVKALISEGRDINIFDDLGRTPLHWAARHGHTDIMKILIAAGANVNAHDESRIGDTTLGEVAGSCTFEVAKLLIDAGAEPTIRGWMQLNALYKSSKRKKPEGVRVHELLTCKARA